MTRRTMLRGLVAAAVSFVLRPAAAFPALRPLGHAAGGYVLPGETYRIGEMGPEYLILDDGGRIEYITVVEMMEDARRLAAKVGGQADAIWDPIIDRGLSA